MENASKALLMAASILIGVVIMSLAVYLYVSFNSSVNEINAQIEEGQLQQFNNKFTSYEDKSKSAGLTIYDIITVTNLAKENNEYYELKESTENNFYITVELNSKKLEKVNDLSTYLTNENEMVNIEDEYTGEKKELKKYTCSVFINENTGRVNKIEFKQKK